MKTYEIDEKFYTQENLNKKFTETEMSVINKWKKSLETATKKEIETEISNSTNPLSPKTVYLKEVVLPNKEK